MSTGLPQEGHRADGDGRAHFLCAGGLRGWASCMPRVPLDQPVQMTAFVLARV